jgi:hypothetical protein
MYMLIDKENNLVHTIQIGSSRMCCIPIVETMEQAAKAQEVVSRHNKRLFNIYYVGKEHYGVYTIKEVDSLYRNQYKKERKSNLWKTFVRFVKSKIG